MKNLLFNFNCYYLMENLMIAIKFHFSVIFQIINFLKNFNLSQKFINFFTQLQSQNFYAAIFKLV